jgi:uncharacterized protein (TIGR03437 family)
MSKMATRVLPGLAIGFLLACGELAAQTPISFLRYQDVLIGTGLKDVLSGDFNGDGKLDLIVNSAANLLLLLGNGDGSFKKVDLGFVANLAAVADVNRDKKLDLLVATSLGAYLLLLGNGDGTFQPAKLLPAFPLAVADFTGDGIPDLLVGQPCVASNGSFSVYPGNGDGTFQSSLACSPATSEGDFGGGIVVGDVNGDGKLDVIWGNIRSSDRVYLWLGNGDGTFQPPAFILADAGQGGKPIALGDLNHDGKPDLAVGNSYGLAVMLGNGDGTFQPPLLITAFDGLQPGNPGRRWNSGNDIFIRDLDGDGKLDIVLDDIVVRGNGDGTFQPPEFLGEASAFAISVICADLNGDGKPDLVYMDANSSYASAATMLSILLNDSQNGLPNSVLGYSAASGGSLLAPSSIASAYGKNLAKVTAAAVGATFPTQLGGISLRVRDDTDTVSLAQLIYVSPSQINFVVPAGTSVGPVTLNIDDGSPPLLEGANATIVTDTAIGFFSANGPGQGVAAATAVRVQADGTQQPVSVFACASAGQCSATPIDLASGLPVYLSLYGTGFGTGPALLQSGTCQVGGLGAKIQFFGPQGVYPGLDQLNLLLPQSLPSGAAPVQCGASNAVQIAIK